MRYAELELALHRRDSGSYALELRFSPPDGEVDVRLIEGGPAAVQFDLDRLRALSLEPSSYAALLSKGLFKNAAVLTAFN